MINNTKTNKPVLYTHNPAAYAAHSAFKTKKELNTSFEMWLADYKRVFGRKELQALKTLVRYSVKVFGIATLKYSTLVSNAKEKYGFDFCSRTAKRAVEKARQLGMLNTLETRKKGKDGSYINGPSIYIWQPYKCKNVTAVNVVDEPAIEELESHEINVKSSKVETLSQEDLAAKMSPHKTLKNKTNIIKLLNTYTYVSTRYKSISKTLRIKKMNHVQLFTQPVKPLRFHSRLKQVIYSSMMNNKSDLKAISAMIYGKVHRYTRFPAWKDHRETMLEHSLRVIEVCLNARKKGHLNKIKSMLGFINHALDEEINAYILNHIEKMALSEVKVSTSKKIINLYT